ncbi:MAG: DUF3394 domain-containing protein, partial [candidate division WOR-3 bacterium]
RSWPQAILIFTMAVFGALAFSNVVQGWFIIRLKWYEMPLLLIASVVLFFPAVITKTLNLDYGLRYYMYFIGLALYCSAYGIQKLRQRRLQS